MSITRKQLTEQTKDQLVELAEAKDVEVPKRWTKERIVDTLLAALKPGNGNGDEPAGTPSPDAETQEELHGLEDAAFAPKMKGQSFGEVATEQGISAAGARNRVRRALERQGKSLEDLPPQASTRSRYGNDVAMKVVKLRDAGGRWSEVCEKTGVAPNTARRLYERAAAAEKKSDRKRAKS